MRFENNEWRLVSSDCQIPCLKDLIQLEESTFMYIVLHSLIFVREFGWIIARSYMADIHSLLNRGKGSYVQDKHRADFLLYT